MALEWGAYMPPKKVSIITNINLRLIDLLLFSEHVCLSNSIKSFACVPNILQGNVSQ